MIYGLFNSKNGQFVGFVTNPTNLPPNSLIKEFDVDDEQFNLARYTWKGDYYHGELVDLNKGVAQVNEYLIETKNAEIFWRKTDKTQLIFDILTFIETGITSETLKKTIDLKNKIVEKQKVETEHFKNSPIHNYRSKEDIVNETKKAFES